MGREQRSRHNPDTQDTQVCEGGAAFREEPLRKIRGRVRAAVATEPQTNETSGRDDKWKRLATSISSSDFPGRLPAS